jgi:hypothetical protein
MAVNAAAAACPPARHLVGSALVTVDASEGWGGSASLAPGLSKPASANRVGLLTLLGALGSTICHNPRSLHLPLAAVVSVSATVVSTRAADWARVKSPLYHKEARMRAERVFSEHFLGGEVCSF